MRKFHHNMILLLFPLLLFIAASEVYAHQPRLVMDKNASKENPIMVEAPEISKAYYGRLKGKPDYYKIISTKPFRLYLGILLPNISGDEMNFVSAQVTDSTGKQVLVLDSTQYQWRPYFEKFGGDWYLEGPEAKINLPAGTYFIEVYNSTNRGKYSLAIGDIESFPPLEIVKTLVLLPIIKERFFNKAIFLPFLQLVGIFIILTATTVMSIIRFRFRKSIDLTQKIAATWRTAKPFLWIGLIVTIIIWFITYLENPFNILAAFNNLILVIAIILFLNISWRLSKTDTKKKIPSKRMVISCIVWLLFLFIYLVLV
jgi:hypothetical protein